MVARGLIIFLVIIGCAAVCLVAYGLSTIIFGKSGDGIDRSRPAPTQEEYMREVRQKNKDLMWAMSNQRIRFDPSYA